MPNKKNFALRVSPEMYSALEKWAADEFRSLNGQIEYVLHNGLKESGRWPKKSTKEDSSKSTPKEK